MKKYYFALFGALMAATCSMAATQSGDRIIATQALSVEWSDEFSRPTVDEISCELSWKAQLSPTEDDNVLILSGLCDLFNIPVHVDEVSGTAWIEASLPLDAYIDKRDDDQFKCDVVRTIYALPEQRLIDGDADMCSNVHGTMQDDGSIMFDGGIVFLVNESMTMRNLDTSEETTETVWMSSPLFRDMRLLVPNAIHQFTLANALVELETLAPTESPSSSQQNYMASRKGIKDYQFFKGKTAEIESGKKPRPKDPSDATICGVIGENDNLVVASNGAPSGVLFAICPLDVDGMIRLGTLGGGKKSIVINPNKLVGRDGGGFGSNEQVAFIRPTGGDVYAQTNDPNDVFDLTAKKRNMPKDPNNPEVCSDPIIWVTPMRTEMGDLPTCNNSNTSIASSKPANEQFSEPVYVFQDPEDNSIKVYNLYGSGCVMNMSDCQVTSESITWGITIPYDEDGNISCYFDSNVLFYTDGTKFVVPVTSDILVKGDVSNDGKVNITDVTMLIDHLLTTGNDGANQVVADVNEDGKLNIADVTTLIDTLLCNAD